MTRDRIQTEQRLIDAVHELITEGGFDKVRINRVAQRAKVNKILIYRYFGGLEGLVTAYYEKYKPVIFAPSINYDELVGVSTDDFYAVCLNYILTEFRLLRANPEAKEFLRNDLLTHKPGMLNPFVAQKEEQQRTITTKLGELAQSPDSRGIAAIMMSGMTQLTLMGQDKRKTLGIDIGTDEGWDEIERGLKQIFYGLSLAAKERLGDTMPGAEASTDSQQPV